MIEIKVLPDEENYHIYDFFPEEEIERMEKEEEKDPNAWLRNPLYSQPFLQIGNKKLCKRMFNDFGYGPLSSEPLYVHSWTITQDERYVVICATVCVMQGGVIIIWDVVKEAIIDIKEGDYCFCAALYKGYLYRYIHVQNYICNDGPYIEKTKFDEEDWDDTGLRIPAEDENLDCISMETRDDGLYLRYQNYDTKEFKNLHIAQ